MTHVELASLARYLNAQREAILEAWRRSVRRDPSLTTGDALPRTQLFDHIPAMLATFEHELLQLSGGEVSLQAETSNRTAAAHGLQRWQQGYDLREVTRELGKLNECVVVELDRFAAANAQLTQNAIATARRLWAEMCSTAIEESVGQFFQLQQKEAAGHVKDLESALADIRVVEKERADLWRQAAHDLRGNLGVVANASVGLTHGGLRESSREEFVRILIRNITALHHLLDDVTIVARLQAGRESRRIEPIDVTPIMHDLCEGVRPLAVQRRLFLRCDGPPGFAVDGDAVKIRRIAQNLLLNAVKYTRDGGITVSWGDSDSHDPKRWALCIKDTGPGFHTPSGKPLAQALEHTDKETPTDQETPIGPASPSVSPSEAQGEGIGLSIVKRLCDMLDASVEMESIEGTGTTYRLLFPRAYPN